MFLLCCFILCLIYMIIGFRYHIRWAHPFTNLDSTVFAPYFRFANATGGMMIQTSTLDIDLNDSTYVNIKCNFPFDMYVFRSGVDFETTRLPWLGNFTETQTYMQFKGAKNSDGRCWLYFFGQRLVPKLPTRRDRFGARTHRKIRCFMLFSLLNLYNLYDIYHLYHLYNVSQVI